MAEALTAFYSVYVFLDIRSSMDIAKHPKIQLSHRKIKIQIHFDFFIIFYDNNVLSIVYGRSCCKFIGRQEHTNVTSQMYFLLK